MSEEATAGAMEELTVVVMVGGKAAATVEVMTWETEGQLAVVRV